MHHLLAHRNQYHCFLLYLRAIIPVKVQLRIKVCLIKSMSTNLMTILPKCGKFRLKNLYIMPPSIYHHKLLWTNKGAVSTIESLHMFVYMYSVCINLWKVENEGNSFYFNTHSIHQTLNVDFDLPEKKGYIMVHMTSVKHRCQFFVLLFVLSFNFFILTAIIFSKVSALQCIGILCPSRRANIFLIQGSYGRLFPQFFYSTK
jgi:hypothetical protein